MFQSQKLDTRRHQKNKIFEHFPTKKEWGKEVNIENSNIESRKWGHQKPDVKGDNGNVKNKVFLLLMKMHFFFVFSPANVSV